MVICLELGADLHVAQLMPLPLTVSCFSKIQIGFTFLVPAYPGSPGQRAVKRVCVCVCVCDCRVFCILPYFSHISAKCAYRIFFPHELAFSTAVLIFLVFLLPISIRFRHLDHLIANRMAPSMCLDPCGTRWGSWFQEILYHIFAYFCRVFGVYAFRIFFSKMLHKTDMPTLYSIGRQ